jgi:hypothetical protein
MAFAFMVVLWVVFGLVVEFFVFASIYRLAVKIVAQFYPGYGNILFTLIVTFIVGCAAGFGMEFAGLAAAHTVNALLFRFLISYVIGILVFAVMIKNRNGQSLGIFNAFIANIVMQLICIALACLILGGFMGVYGYHPVLDTLNVNFHKAEDAYLKAQAIAAARANASPTPSNIPSVDQLLQQPPPGAAHYYLKTPLTVTVAYGQMTYPANTEVQLLSQSGDQCRIQIANNTLTVSRGQLTTALQ